MLINMNFLLEIRKFYLYSYGLQILIDTEYIIEKITRL